MNRSRVYNALCIHWDHHPFNAAQQYGAGTNTDDIRRYLSHVKPDVTQYHTIGTYGYASFPSLIAPVVPGLVGDPLKTWSQACAEEGVAFGCYAAAFNCQSPDAVPQWRCINRAGLISNHAYCPNGSWAEEFFIPFLKEVIQRYHPVHFWLDGTWTATNQADFCFCTHCQERFYAQYGRLMPENPSATEWPELLDFHEKSLDDAISRISRSIKALDPAVLLACNHLYYYDDARRPINDIDWLSWDALNTPDLHRASFESTYISTAGKPADVMIYEQGIIHWQPTLLRRPRTTAQILAEASTILAHGNRVNLWHDPAPNGAIPAGTARLGQSVADFVRCRQAWCIGNQSVAEVAVLISRLDHCSDAQKQSVAIRAIQQLLQEAHIPCDLVREDTLLNQLVQYHLVILPETHLLTLDTAQWLHQYALDGGRILYVAPNKANLNVHWFDTLLGTNASCTYASHAGGKVINGDHLVVVEHDHFDLPTSWRSIYHYEDGTPWLSRFDTGEGALYMVTGAALSEYDSTHWPPLRDLVASAARECIGQLPLVDMVGHPGIEIVVNRRDNDLYLHFVNLTPGTSLSAPNEVFYDEVATCHDLELVVRPPRQPSAVTLWPDGTKFDEHVQYSECRDESSYCTLRILLPELKYHCALQLVGAASA